MGCVSEGCAMTHLVAAALAYAARRLPVFPCLPQDKVPAIARGFHAATTNPETIRRHWRVADRNIGIPTGSVSGFWVLDIDGDAGAASLRALEAKHGPLPATRQVITGGGGRHLWFKYIGPIQSTAGKIAPGIDSRGDGGYVVVPPSVHANGRAYAWAVNCAPELAEAPQWLVQLARKSPAPTISERALAKVIVPTSGQTQRDVRSDAYGQAALDDEIAILAATLPGGRNHALNRAAFCLFQLVAGGELDRNLVVDRLIDASHRNGLIKDDGLPSVIATIRSGAHAGRQHPRCRGVA
jgi:hypothetical protein